VSFNLIKSGTISIVVKDVIGQTVYNAVNNRKFDSGQHHVELPELAPGVYMINVTVNNKQHVVKLIVS
jgi:hypothetical protein